MAVEVNSAARNYYTVTPHLTVHNAEAAIAFYKKAFGAEEVYRMPTSDGLSILYAELKIGNSLIFLNDEFPDMGEPSPTTLKGSPVTLHLDVDDVDAWFGRAIQAGAAVTMPIEDMFWGDRYGKLIDPFGHNWSIASPIAQRSSDKMQRAKAL